MKANRGASTLEDGAAQIVVDQGPGDPRPGLKGLDMAAQKTLERLVDGEECKDGARVGEHHHEARERPHAATEPNRAEGAPVDLGFQGSSMTDDQN